MLFFLSGALQCTRPVYEILKKIYTANRYDTILHFVNHDSVSFTLADRQRKTKIL